MYRHGAVRTVTNTASYTGVTTKLILPTSISVPDGYVDWYLGIGDEVIESGISYSYEGFKVFLGVKEYGQPNSHPVPSLKMGQKCRPIYSLQFRTTYYKTRTSHLNKLNRTP